MRKTKRYAQTTSSPGLKKRELEAAMARKDANRLTPEQEEQDREALRLAKLNRVQERQVRL